MEPSSKRKPSSSLADALTPLANKRPRPPSYMASPVGSFINPTSSQTYMPNKKVCYFNDPVHGTIGMSDLCLEIIDTKEFQRLRDLKQLGTADYVYPGATHTRFSHSLGVAHFAEKTLRTLMRNQPELDITEVDVLCVKVAGLCHDLGHGPFSHVFDGVFMSRMHSNTHFKHEDWSVCIFKSLMSKKQINPQAYGLQDVDVLFISEIISGTKAEDRRGRPAHKFYLYDIINNTRSGLDVDKLDYFQRDIKHTNVDASYNQFQRFVEFGRVMPAEPLDVHGAAVVQHPTWGPVEYMLCYPEKMVSEAVQLFDLRFRLHQKVYTHKSVKKVEYMLVDAMQLADPYILIPGNPRPSSSARDSVPVPANSLFSYLSSTHASPASHASAPNSQSASSANNLYKMSEAYLDPAGALVNLTDGILYRIETSTEDELKPARDIIERIRRRDFYKCLGKMVYKRESPLDNLEPEAIAQAIHAIALKLQREGWGRASSAPPTPTAGTSPVIPTSSGNPFLSNPYSSQYFPSFLGGEVLDPPELIQSQDSFAPWLVPRQPHASPSVVTQDPPLPNHPYHPQLPATPVKNNGNANGNANGDQNEHNRTILPPLSPHHLIVEKMHLHYGLKHFNPVSRLRFYSKDQTLRSYYVARSVGEGGYDPLLPRAFEERGIRVFCRVAALGALYGAAFQQWSRQVSRRHDAAEHDSGIQLEDGRESPAIVLTQQI